MLQDLRYSLRSLLRAPGFTLIVVATLALGIGASLTMFSLVRAVLWRPLPYPDPDRIVTIQVDARNVRNAGATRTELLGLRERSRSFDQVSTIDSVDANLEFNGQTDRVPAASVTAGFLPLLGAQPALGRLPDPDRSTNSRVLLSDDLWHRRFSASPAIIGKSIRINNADMEVAAILPPGFRLFLSPRVTSMQQVDIWLLSQPDPAIPYRGVPVVARLRPGVTLLQANAELETLAARFEREHPDFYSGTKGWQASPSDHGPGPKVRFTASLMHDDMTRESRPALFLLSCAVAFVLLIACVNVANLLLARGSSRHRELQIRRALGAGGGRIVLQLLTEGLVLAFISAAIGLLGTRFALAGIARFSASHLPFQSPPDIDAPVLLFALALSLLTSVLFGLLPAFRLAAVGSAQPLRAGRAETAGLNSRRLQRTLVAAEVALSIVPLAGAGLMLRSFVNLNDSPLGFNPSGVVTARLPFDAKRYPRVEPRWEILRSVFERLRAVPGVQSVSAANPLPLADQEHRRIGRLDHPDAPPLLATQQFALPGYLAAIGTPLLQGRDFTDDDIASQRLVTIIDEAMAKRLWPEGALGKRLAVYRTGWHSDLEVIGVTAPVRVTRVRDDSIPHFMLPYSTYPGEMTLVIRTTETAGRLAPQIASAVDAAHSGRAAFNIRPMNDYVSDSIGDTRFLLLVLAAFAVTSALLTAVGLYGTLAYLCAQRTREFGIRLAMGSGVTSIVAIVVKESVLLASVGLVLGLLGAAAFTKAIRELLYGVRPVDAPTLAAAAGLVLLIALLAAGVPAWRAARTDPQVSLRGE